ncbi:MAG: response regulator [Candidatus Methanomethyliaceae archaeon]|nr:response regulator [Candidatus Methanomethyliaceae archaeon]
MVEPARILVIDDDENILYSIKEILSKEGYIVHTAISGEEALQKLKDNFYNLVIIDIRLPDIDGLELIKKFKDTLPKMRKVIITGYASLENAIKAINLGANVYIMKPLSPNILLEVIDKELRLQKEELAELQNNVVSYAIKEAKNRPSL